MQGMMRVASACSMFSLPCAEKRHCSTTRPPPPMCWAMIFRGHSALLPTLRMRRTEDVDSLSWGTQTTEVCVKLNVPFDQLLRTTPPHPPPPHPCWSCRTETDENVFRCLALVSESTRSRSYSPYSWGCLRLISGEQSVSAASGLFLL